MILVDYIIKKYVNDGTLVIDNFSEECVQPATYDMRIGDEVFLSTKKDVLNLSKNVSTFFG